MSILDRGDTASARHLRVALREALNLGRGVAFWVGVVLPVVYLPAVVGGLVRVRPGTFVGLVLLNHLALLAGAGYRRPANE